MGEIDDGVSAWYGSVPNFLQAEREQRLRKTGRYMSLLLRHQPEKEGLQMDQEGWVSTDDLTAKLGLSNEDLKEIVKSNDKQRFQFDCNGLKIRAVQGHSLPFVNIQYPTAQPQPKVLYHGTTQNVLNDILVHGLKKMSRSHVHLSTDVQTAYQVGRRHGRLVVIFEVDCEGLTVLQAPNNVYLVQHVPPENLTFLSETTFMNEDE